MPEGQLVGGADYSLSRSQRQVQNAIPTPAEHGPGSILQDKLSELMGQSERIVQALSAVHAKLGGPLPERANSAERGVDPTPCGGAIGGAIQASRAIGTNLDRADDLLGYLRALIA